MGIAAGRHRLGTENGRITLRTFRDGLAAQAGHDLTIEAGRWSGELVVGPDLTPARLSVSVDLGALVVRAGTGGIKPLTDRDKRDIAASARKVLSADRYPEATFTATAFEPGPHGAGGTIVGTLSIAGRSQPQQLKVSQPASGQYLAQGTIRQTSFGIKPYSAFLGSLKVADAVELEAEVDLSQAAEKEPAA
jgi:polyisoprenoid-binding protein YceI